MDVIESMNAELFRYGLPGLGAFFGSLENHAIVTKKFFPSHFPLSDQ